MCKREDVQDFNMWGAGWMVVTIIGLGLEREKKEERWGQERRSKEEKEEKEGVNSLPLRSFDLSVL